MRYSAWHIFKEGLTGNKGWGALWRKAEPKKRYKTIIVGGGGHGLATAHYLAKEHGITDVCVLEKGWIGGGNVGRNTTIVRSNYLLPGNEPFYELSMKLWEGLEQDLNYNAMVSQRGVLNLYHSDPQRDAYRRRGNAMIMAGADADLLDSDGVRALYPALDFDNARFPIMGGLLQKRGGSVRHDAVAWGYARAAASRGVDICENCAESGFVIEDGVCKGVETAKGTVLADQVIVLSGRPARTQYVMDVHLEGPRDIEMLYTPESAEALNVLRQQIRIAQGRDAA